MPDIIKTKLANLSAIYKCTKAQYTNLSSKSNAYLYVITDTQELYIGNYAVANLTPTYKETLGDGSLTSFSIIHNLGTLDIIVFAYLLSTGESVEIGVTRVDENTITITTTTAPSLNDLRVMVIGV